MNTITDTLTAAQALQDAGVEEDQARAHVQVMAQIVRETQGDLATKADIAELKSATEANVVRLEAEISGLRTATEAHIAKLESEIKAIKWMLGTGLGILVLMITLMVALMNILL